MEESYFSYKINFNIDEIKKKNESEIFYIKDVEYWTDDNITTVKLYSKYTNGDYDDFSEINLYIIDENIISISANGFDYFNCVINIQNDVVEQDVREIDDITFIYYNKVRIDAKTSVWKEFLKNKKNYDYYGVKIEYGDILKFYFETKRHDKIWVEIPNFF